MPRRPEEPGCPLCGQPLEMDIDGDWVCADCLYVAPPEDRLRFRIARLDAQVARNNAVLKGNPPCKTT